MLSKKERSWLEGETILSDRYVAVMKFRITKKRNQMEKDITEIRNDIALIDKVLQKSVMLTRNITEKRNGDSPILQNNVIEVAKKISNITEKRNSDGVNRPNTPPSEAKQGSKCVYFNERGYFCSRFRHSCSYMGDKGICKELG